MPRNASLALLALLALLVAAAATSVARADYPSIYVTFLPTSTLRVMLADGTLLGTSSGAPTVIPPGSYNLLLDDSSLVSDVTFDLAGPNVKLITNMSYGEETAETWVETFLPNSSYTWRDDMKPATDVVGSAVVPFRGTLLGAVTAAGTDTLTSGGKAVTTLKAGRYTVKVTDRSAKSGFSVQQSHKNATNVTATGFVGTRSATITLKPGQWFFYPTFVGKKTYFLVVA